MHTSSKFQNLLISNLLLTNTELGRGADATVYLIEWNGTPCAAKRLHNDLLGDQSLGGKEKLLSNFEGECLTWSKLRHPRIVQFLGVHLEPGSHVTELIMEKMDTSLRKYLEGHSKEEFPLGSKAFVLHQITQALAYLHSQDPPLVHHDLSPNNVLLNVDTLVTKLTDFGMSRAINPSALTRKSSIKGTRAFMSPEALQTPPWYNEKLDVFSFGNIILSTITHEWPEPRHPTKRKGDRLIALDEFQRREHYVELFTAQEKQLFLPTLCDCLMDRPNDRPSSVMLVQKLKCIESSLKRDDHVVAPIEQLRQQLSAKEEECRQKDKVIREKDEALMVKDDALRLKDEALTMTNEVSREKERVLKEKDEALQEKNAAIQTQEDTIQEQQASIQAQRTAIENQKATIRAQQDTIQEKQDSIQDQRTAIQNQKDAIQARQTEIEQLKHLLAVAQTVR